ncbi:MAG TPA: MBL fold metallo-hydrolase [Conexibacter sp.]|jgi:glyoxylase-like metal-dependent hydrolase (beta-lactamase superfamily II)
MSSAVRVGDALQGELVRLGDHSYYVHSDVEAAANAGFVVGEHTTLVVDTRLTPTLGADLRKLAERAGAAVDAAEPQGAAGGPRELWFVNTHFHGDHCFGNSAFADCLGFASHNSNAELARSWERQVDSFAGRRPYLREQLAGADPVLPSVTFEGTLALDLGGVTVELETVGQAHTDSDLVVKVPADGVVYAADLLYHGHWPVLKYGDYATWMAALDELERSEQYTFFVPGHGVGGGKEVVRAVQGSWELLFAQAQGDGAEEDVTAAIERSAYAGWLRRERVPDVVQQLRAERRG